MNALIHQLDEYYDIHNFPPDDPFSSLFPSCYGNSFARIVPFIQQSFLKSFHGLMIRNGDRIERVLLSVFLGSETVRKIVDNDYRNSLMVAHHPLIMETSGRGFMPLSIEDFYLLRDLGTSVYILHTPLDNHSEISPSFSLARALDLRNTRRYARNQTSFLGVYGNLPTPLAFEDLLNRLRSLLGIRHIEHQKRIPVVARLGIIAGGGSYLENIMETQAQGCDTYLTGEYYNRVQNEFGSEQRELFKQNEHRFEINLIAGSHYATEKIVMMSEMRNLIERCGYPCIFIEQDDPWY